MSNPFDDLESDDGSDNESENDTTSTDELESSQPAPKSEDVAVGQPTTETDREPVRDEAADGTSPADPSESGPAFEYSEVRQKPLYAKDSEWDAFEKNIRTTIAPQLAEADVVDEETREIHNAVLRLANEQPERIAELILEERQQS